jgi:hypothetical protein
MPVISIQSLPFSPAIKAEQVLSQLSQAFSEQFNIQLEHVSANWRYLDRHHYVVAGKSAEFQCPYSHPILVELLAPDFTQPQDVENMLTFIASQLAKLIPIQKTNIFIEYRAAKSGWIFDQGKIVRW